MVSTKSVALVNELEREATVMHFQGMPPELAGGQDQREVLSSPRVLVIEESSEGIYLFRFTERGVCVGDTWHMDVEEAKEQAEYEYGEVLTEWHSVPNDVADPIVFALALATSQ